MGWGGGDVWREWGGGGNSNMLDWPLDLNHIAGMTVVNTNPSLNVFNLVDCTQNTPVPF